MDILSCTMGSNEAAMISGYTTGYIKDSCASGMIKSKKIGSVWVIDKRLFNLKKQGSINLLLVATIANRIKLCLENGIDLEEALDTYMRSEMLSGKEQVEILSRIKVISL